MNKKKKSIIITVVICLAAVLAIAGILVFPKTSQPEETVKLLETTCQDGKIWILCENSSKEQGWLEDPEEYLYDESTGCSGCFKEAVFAG